MPRSFLFTSEQVSEGHPDKVCDQISDRILDEILSRDPHCRVAAETAIKGNDVFLLGEISTSADVDYEQLVRDVLKEIGYDDEEHSCDWASVRVHNYMSQQSNDIFQAVFREDSATHSTEICAGDQGMVVGYASNETKSLMPATHKLATMLIQRLSEVRRSGELPYLRPDAKAQVTLRYEEDEKTKALIPKDISTIILSTQHSEEIDNSTLRNDLFRAVVLPTIRSFNSQEGLTLEIRLPACERGDNGEINYNSFDFADWTMDEISRGYLKGDATPSRVEPADFSRFTVLMINPSGRFVLGGPKSDCGLTGRKIIADSYGSFGSHGGGAFSGKDASKVDRSGSYLARNIAKCLCAPENDVCKRCMVQIGYAIGVAAPVSIYVDCYGSETQQRYKDPAYLEKIVRKNFRLTPGGIIEAYDLARPQFYETSKYGHFGRESFKWEAVRKLNLDV